MCVGKGILAMEENFGHVLECACGTVHVNVGPISVALDRNAMRRLHDMLGAAIARLDAAPDEFERPERFTTHAAHLEFLKTLNLKH